MEVNHETNASSHVDEDADAVEAVMKDRSLLEAKQRAYDEHHQHQNQIIEAEASDASDAESFLEDLLAFNQGTTDDKASATDKANGEKMVGNAYQKTAVIPLPGAVSVASGKEGWGGDGGKNLPNITKKETDKSNNESSGGALTRNGAQEATAETTPKPPAPEELQRRPNVVANSRPGAYSYTPDQGLQRSSTLTVAMGAGPPEPPEEEIEAGHAGSGTDAVQAGTRSRDNFEPNNGEPNNNLVEATPVTEDDQLPAGNLGAARQVDLEEERHKAEARKQEQKKFFIGVALLVLLGVGIVGIVAGTRGGRNETKIATVSPTLAPSPMPTSTPSVAPSSPLDLFLGDLPDSTLESLMTFGTPQSKAFSWLENHQNLTNLPLWKKTQLFALATFFYSFEGEHWPALVQDRWLDDTKDECLWFSGEFGYFDEDTGEYIEVDSYGISPCNQDGEYQSLKMGNLQLNGLLPTMPPEIGLLTSLSVVGLGYNGIYGPLTNMMPTQLYQLTNLTLFNCRTNHLSGSLPTEIGLLSNSLKSIYLYENPLSGAFPSELGLLTSMTQMDITYTHISSTIPSELFLMTNMESLYLAHNYLVGTIPPEIGLMTKMAAFWINNNTLTGSIPSQFGMLTDMSSVGLHQNSLSGSLPSELGRLTNVNQMSLRQNRFSGLMPLALCPWDCQEKISPFPAEGFLGRETAVSSDDCNCTVGEAFPLPNATNEVTINVQFDGWPEETSFSFKELDGKQNWVPKLSVTGSTDDSWNLVSYKEKSLTSNTLFHFYISDIWADGICCGGGVSITNGTKPVELIGTAYEEYQGTIVWSAQGYDEFEASAEVYLWVDSNGHVAVVTEEEGKNLTATIAHGG